MLPVGVNAPNPEIETHLGYNGPLSHFWQDGPLVLFFYPKDHTRVCTKQACTLQASVAEFGRLGANVLGSSTGSVNSHLSFAEKNGIDFPLIADERGEVAKLFQAFRPLIRISKRITYVIGKDGKIIGNAHHELSVPPHLGMIRETLGLG